MYGVVNISIAHVCCIAPHVWIDQICCVSLIMMRIRRCAQLLSIRATSLHRPENYAVSVYSMMHVSIWMVAHSI
jgi:hypothetical protein